MRRRFVQIDGVLVEYGQHLPERIAPDVMPDIAPYVSMVDGRLITSRSVHREHLKDHGMVEVGNDSSLTTPYKGIPQTAPQQLKEILRAQVSAMTNAQFEKARLKDLNNLRWNTRQD